MSPPIQTCLSAIGLGLALLGVYLCESPRSHAVQRQAMATASKSLRSERHPALSAPSGNACQLAVVDADWMAIPGAFVCDAPGPLLPVRNCGTVRQDEALPCRNVMTGAPGFTSRIVSLGPGRTTTRLQREGELLHGFVLDANGGAVEAAVVTVTSHDGILGLALSDHAGRFSVGSKPIGESTLRVVADGYAVWARRMPLDTPVEVVLAPQACVRGSIRDWRGDPASAAALDVIGSGLPYYSATTGFSDALGRFLMCGLHPGAHWIRARKERSTSERLLVQLSAAEQPDVHLVLGGETSLDGHVRLDGLPVPGCAIDVVGPESKRVVTNEHGAFEATALLVGRYEVTAHCEGAIPETKELDSSQGVTGVDFELNRGGGVRVSTSPSISPDKYQVWLRCFSEQCSSRACLPEANGVFVCGGIRAGVYSAELSNEGLVLASKDNIRVANNAIAEVHLNGFTFARVKVNLLSEQGGRVNGAAVALARDDVARVLEYRGSGPLDFGALPPGRYHLSVGSSEKWLDLNPGTSLDVHWRVQTGTIRGVLRDSDGLPAAETWVTATSTDELRSLATPVGSYTDASGAFEISDVAMDTYALSAFDGSGKLELGQAKPGDVGLELSL